MKLSLLIFLLQAADIEQKMENAPDNKYGIGIALGAYIPLVFFIGLAYLTYYLAKKRDE